MLCCSQYNLAMFGCFILSTVVPDKLMVLGEMNNGGNETTGVNFFAVSFFEVQKHQYVHCSSVFRMPSLLRFTLF